MGLVGCLCFSKYRMWAVDSPWYAKFYESWGAHEVAAEQTLSHTAAGRPAHNWLETGQTQPTTHQCGY